MEHEHVQIYTRKWFEDGPVTGEGVANAHLDCRVFIDGKEIASVIKIEVKSVTADFSEVTLAMSPASLEWIGLNEEEWQALGK